MLIQPWTIGFICNSQVFRLRESVLKSVRLRTFTQGTLSGLGPNLDDNILDFELIIKKWEFEGGDGF